ncbi:sigma factor-like helix-turn-helix DNA-binding protein [Arthrobacter sp. RCC_34]|uniref:sigma factor-like helix-turn-helix DNA-binding protein n=1 Tax=Arthrobacter sp. RCC_34 TaxID=3239230 RepID=UPI003524F9E5
MPTEEAPVPQYDIPAEPGLSVVGLVGRPSHPVYPEKTLTELQDLNRALARVTPEESTLKPPSRTWRLSTAQERQLVDAYDHGATISELGRRFGISRGRVRTIVAKYDATQDRQPHPKEAEFAQAVTMYEAGQTLKSISATVGMPETTLRIGLVKRGVRMRPRGKVKG